MRNATAPRRDPRRTGSKQWNRRDTWIVLSDLCFSYHRQRVSLWNVQCWNEEKTMQPELLLWSYPSTVMTTRTPTVLKNSIIIITIRRSLHLNFSWAVFNVDQTWGGAGSWLDMKVSAPCQAWIPKICIIFSFARTLLVIRFQKRSPYLKDYGANPICTFPKSLR